VEPQLKTILVYTTAAGFSTELNLQDVMTFKLNYLDVNVQKSGRHAVQEKSS